MASDQSERRRAWKAARLHTQAARQQESQETRKLQDLLACGGISLRGAADFMRRVNELPEDQRSLTYQELADVNSSRLTLIRRCENVPLERGGTLEWEYADPNLLLTTTIDDCPELARVYARRLNEHPCSEQRPWSIVVAFDEFTPGSARAPDNRKKAMVLSYNFLELGREVLRHEASWLVPVVVRRARRQPPQPPC